MMGTAASSVAHAPEKFTAATFATSSNVSDEECFVSPRPAFAMTRSRLPISRSARLTASFVAAASVTSSGRASARPPFARISAASDSSSSTRRAAAAMCAPPAAYSSATARPMPLDAPVMNTVLGFTRQRLHRHGDGARRSFALQSSRMGSIETNPARRIGFRLADRWDLRGVLGVGGAGAVYEAVGPSGERVAVKILHEHLADEPEVRTRFVREGYLANRIDHPGIVRVLGDGEDEQGLPYLVMELLEGETFAARQARKGGVLPVNEVLWLADRTLGVLTKAHAKGILHRDLKPENLFLTRDRKLKVL